MRKIKLYIAASLNGKIAGSDGSVDWLHEIPNPEKLDYGYTDFYASIDATIQGFSTYNQIINWDIDFPYADKKNYVLTRNKERKNTEHVEFISEGHGGFIRNLKNQEGKDIWLIGGGRANTLLLNEGLIDEIRLFVMPVILPGGIDLFESIPKACNLTLLEEKSYPSSGVVEMKYKVD